MNNLEQAAQQVLDALGTTWVVVPPDSDERLDAAISALEKALAEKQEPLFSLHIDRGAVWRPSFEPEVLAEFCRQHPGKTIDLYPRMKETK